MGPNVKILMGQSFGSWTHGHGPMALGAWAAALEYKMSINNEGFIDTRTSKNPRLFEHDLLLIRGLLIDTY